LKIFELKRPDAEEIQVKISKNTKYEDYPLSLTYINGHSSDIRGIMLDLNSYNNPKTFLSRKPEKKTDKFSVLDLVRDPTEETFSILRRIYESFKKRGYFTKYDSSLLDLDKYNSIFQLYENYINWTPVDKLSKVLILQAVRIYLFRNIFTNMLI